jgi:hypothetical protein
MSKISDARDYADNALGQGISTLVSVPERVVSLSGDARERAGRSVEDGKGVATSVVSLTRRQVQINVGVSDAIVATIIKRAAELPEDARHAATSIADAAVQRVSDAAERTTRVQDKLVQVAGGLKDRAGNTVDSVRGFTLTGATSDVRDDLQSRIARISDGLDKFAERGEQVTDDLRHDPVVARVLSDAGKGVEQAANEITSIAQKVRSRAAAQVERESAATTSTPVRPVAPGKIPTHKTTVRKTRAGEAAISPTPTHRAAAHEAEIRQAAAVKAAETRKDNVKAAEQATRARKIAAQNAARTRKAAAEESAAKRSAAALKAAETRKEKAEAAELAAERATQVRKDAAIKAAETRKHNAKASELAAEHATEVRKGAAVKAAEIRKNNAVTTPVTGQSRAATPARRHPTRQRRNSDASQRHE